MCHALIKYSILFMKIFLFPSHSICRPKPTKRAKAIKKQYGKHYWNCSYKQRSCTLIEPQPAAINHPSIYQLSIYRHNWLTLSWAPWLSSSNWKLCANNMFLHLCSLLSLLLVSQTTLTLALSSDLNVGSVGGSTVNNGELHILYALFFIIIWIWGELPTNWCMWHSFVTVGNDRQRLLTKLSHATPHVRVLSQRQRN